MTLSYCWRSDGLLFGLTAALEECFMKQLPWAEMPQTFKYTIVSTKKLKNRLRLMTFALMPFALFKNSRKTGRMSLASRDILTRTLFVISLRLPVPTATMAFSMPVILSISSLYHQRRPKSALQGSFTIQGPSNWSNQLDGSPLSSRVWVH